MPDSGACSTVASLRILMTADAVGGVWQYSLDLIDKLLKQGAEVLLATMGPRPTADQKHRLAAMPGVTLRESDYKLEWMDQPWSDVSAGASWLLELAAQFRPDVVHLNGYSHAALPWNAPVVVVAHSCVYSWWQAVHGAAPPQHEWADYHRHVTAGLRAADAIVAPSATMAASLTQQYDVPAGQIRVIHNFSESPGYSETEKEPFYLAAGRIWDKGKNLKLLEHLANRLPWPMRTLSGLPHTDALAQMQHASIYVHPALYEPFGLGILEAARAQCCLVLSDIPSLRELWDGAAAFLDPRDLEAWVQTLSRLSSDLSERESLAQLACRHATRFSADTAVQQYRQLYDLLIRRQAINEASKDAAA